MTETVTVAHTGGGYDDDGNPLDVGAIFLLTPLEIAPGNTSQTPVTGGDLEKVDYTVYFELGTPIYDDDTIIVRNARCKARVRKWESAGLGGLEVLCTSATGFTGA